MKNDICHMPLEQLAEDTGRVHKEGLETRHVPFLTTDDAVTQEKSTYTNMF